MKKRRTSLYLIIAGLSVFGSCLDPSVKQLKKIQLKDSFAEGSIAINGGDTIFDGKINFFTPDGHLYLVAHYNNNERDGSSTNFRPNGTVEQRVSYANNERHGKTVVLDSSEKLAAEINYFHDLMAGPIVRYTIGERTSYEVRSLEGFQLYKCEYNKKSASETGKLLNYLTNYVNENGEIKIQVFLYVINPPHKNLKYFIYKTNKITRDSLNVMDVPTGEEFFVVKLLDNLKPNEEYKLRLQAYYPEQDTLVENVLSPSEQVLILPHAKPL